LILVVHFVFAFKGGAYGVNFERLIGGSVLSHHKGVATYLHMVKITRENRRPYDLDQCRVKRGIPFAVRALRNVEVQNQGSNLLSHVGQATASNDGDSVVSHGDTTLQVETIDSVLGLLHLQHPLH